MIVPKFVAVYYCLWQIVAFNSHLGIVVEGVTEGTSSVLCGNSPVDVLIVGAGFSGLAAAKELKDNNVTNSRIIEATNRVGGRVRSVQPPNFDGLWVEEGGYLVIDFEGNPIRSLVDKYQKTYTLNQFDNYAMFEYNPATQVWR